MATRSYGTTVHRVVPDSGPALYVKATTSADETDPRFHPVAEAAALRWLRERGFPVARVVEVGRDDEWSWLVTEELPGVPASGPWRADQVDAVLDAVAGVAAALHRLPVARCPFDRRLAVTLPACRRAVELGTVDLDDLDERHEGWTGAQLLAELAATPVPPEDLVVCHGDLGLDNVLLDPDTLAPTGLLDAGRLGVADRWTDLSILLRDLAEAGWCDPAGFTARYGLSDVDSAKDSFYRLMDEFI
ncbi:APH(3') family aminoglycoside O-phosphotransferase [Actinokineospora auranticolor]|uniref:APH(3') family aminoglycoside O-phosphotransferase n=1 Tax=Actinokineospora auranticolor TaxID=155976 RepID=UPI0035A871AB